LNITGKNKDVSRSVLIDPAGWASGGSTTYDILKIVSNNATIMKIDTAGNASFAGAITSNSAEITGGSITIKNGDNTVFSASSSGVYTKGEVVATKGDIGGWKIDGDKLSSDAFYFYGGSEKEIDNA
jgi:hypothetical protein